MSVKPFIYQLFTKSLFVLTAILIINIPSIFAQDFESLIPEDGTQKKFKNQIFDPNIKTVQMFRKGWLEAWPVINLNEPNDRLHITFEDLNDDLRNLGYTFIHCGANWLPSDLMKIEYLDGIEDNSIETYGFSATLYQKFVKYDLTFPNRDISFSKSGNYLLVVYDMDNENAPVLTRRFFVMEYYANVLPQIKRPTQARYRMNSHEVDFTVVQNGIDLIQPFSSLKVVVTQNQNWETAITDLKPRFINGRELRYDYDEENIFPAGNQFRVVDIRNINYNAITTQRIATINDTLHAYQFVEKPRSHKVFLTTPDINGHFYIKNDDVRFDSDLESDYMMVHFYLEYPAKVYKGGIYLYGSFTGWELIDDYKMDWNAEKGRYEKALYLKQGYYNYLYMYQNSETGKADIAVIEGSHSEADNEYSFFVYYREPGQVYDRLIGFNTTVFPEPIGRE